MEPVYGRLRQREEWNTTSGQSATSQLTRVDESFSGSITYEIPVAQPALFSPQTQLLSELNYVMKKLALIAIGMTLFVAGYHHIRRQNEYVVAQATLSNTSYGTAPTKVTNDMKNTLAFRLVRPSQVSRRL